MTEPREIPFVLKVILCGLHISLYELPSKFTKANEKETKITASADSEALRWEEVIIQS